MTVLQIAHRAGNDVSLLAAAHALGADLLEADVHLRRGRLEVRHAKSLGPVPWLWEPWYLVRDERLELSRLRAAVPEGASLLLDLKGWQPWLGRRVREVMAGGPPYAVCSRRWGLLEAFEGQPGVRVVHSAGSPRELARLMTLLRARHTWGVSLHRSLVTRERVARLREHADVVMTWPIDTASARDDVVALGVNGVISNDLGVLAAP